MAGNVHHGKEEGWVRGIFEVKVGVPGDKLNIVMDGG